MAEIPGGTAATQSLEYRMKAGVLMAKAMIAYDLRHALQALVRRPGLSCAVLLILALGIGSTTTIVSIASSVLLSEIPYKDGDRLVVLRMQGEQAGSAFPASYLDLSSWREQSRTLELISPSSDGLQL